MAMFVFTNGNMSNFDTSKDLLVTEGNSKAIFVDIIFFLMKYVMWIISTNCLSYEGVLITNNMSFYGKKHRRFDC